MWRSERASAIVHDELFPRQLLVVCFVLWVLLGAALTADFTGPGLPGLVIVLVVTLTLRVRLALHKPDGRVRVSWMLAPTPYTPGIPLRKIVEVDVSGLSEVRVGPPIRENAIWFHPIELVFSNPAFRGGDYSESVAVGACIGRARALKHAGRIAADLGLPVRDIEVQAAPVLLGL